MIISKIAEVVNQFRDYLEFKFIGLKEIGIWFLAPSGLNNCVALIRPQFFQMRKNV